MQKLTGLLPGPGLLRVTTPDGVVGAKKAPETGVSAICRACMPTWSHARIGCAATWQELG